MSARVPVQQHYNLNSPTSFIDSPLHVLNAVDARTAASTIDDISASVDHGASVDCMNESHGNCLPLHSVEVDEDRSSLETSESSRGLYDVNVITFEDVSPIESARARFIQIVMDHFIEDRVIEVLDSDADYGDQDKMNKRRTREIRYEGDSNFALPLMYVANMYETLVNEVNIRLASLSGIRDKSIGVALEASGGLYRRLAKKFPKKGPCIYKRRELATSMETRNRFPELVIQEEKRVRFVVVNGLKIVENPNSVPIDDAEWFKRLTGRNEVAISANDYKFYSPRHKYRRGTSISLPNIQDIPSYSGAESSTTMTTTQGFRSPQNQQQTSNKHHLQSLPHQPQFHPVLQSNQIMHQSQHAGPYSHNHQNCSPSHISEISHSHQPSISQHMSCLQSLTGGHVGGRMHMLPPSPAKFCDECGAPYLRETSKFCSECGSKRFKRLTGRNEVAISANDYKFYSPRHKYRRGTSISLPNIQDIPSYSGAESSTTMTTTQGFRSPQNQQQTSNKHHLQSLPHQPQFHPVLQSNQIMHQSQHAGPYSHNHQNCSPSHISEISHSHQPSISQHMSCLQSLTGGHVGGRMHMLPPSPAKFCDECGAPYLRETSKFCSECGSKRLGT